MVLSNWEKQILTPDIRKIALPQITKPVSGIPLFLEICVAQQSLPDNLARNGFQYILPVRSIEKGYELLDCVEIWLAAHHVPNIESVPCCNRGFMSDREALVAGYVCSEQRSGMTLLDRGWGVGRILECSNDHHALNRICGELSLSEQRLSFLSRVYGLLQIPAFMEAARAAAEKWGVFESPLTREMTLLPLTHLLDVSQGEAYIAGLAAQIGEKGTSPEKVKSEVRKILGQRSV